MHECCIDTICIAIPEPCPDCSDLLNDANNWSETESYYNADYVLYDNNIWFFLNDGFPDNTPNPPGQNEKLQDCNICVGWVPCDTICSLPWYLSGAPIWTLNDNYSDGDVVLIGGNQGQLHTLNATVSPTNTTSTDSQDDPYWSLCQSPSVSSITDPNKPTKKLKKITNLLGQEIPIRKNTPMFYIYDDGSVEKKVIIE